MGGGEAADYDSLRKKRPNPPEMRPMTPRRDEPDGLIGRRAVHGAAYGRGKGVGGVEPVDEKDDAGDKEGDGEDLGHGVDFT